MNCVHNYFRSIASTSYYHNWYVLPLDDVVLPATIILSFKILMHSHWKTLQKLSSEFFSIKINSVNWFENEDLRLDKIIIQLTFYTLLRKRKNENHRSWQFLDPTVIYKFLLLENRSVLFPFFQSGISKRTINFTL